LLEQKINDTQYRAKSTKIYLKATFILRLFGRKLALMIFFHSLADFIYQTNPIFKKFPVSIFFNKKA